MSDSMRDSALRSSPNPGELSVPSATATAGDGQDILVVSGLGVKTHDKTILEDVSFRVRKGTTLAIVGPNGGGKTTLLRSLLGLVPHTGTVTWEQAARIGYVPQSLVATDLPISVEEFIRLKSKTAIESSLDQVGLDRGILKQRLGSLSGGQLQRVLIAWAIVDSPNVLLFDEPTSGVDVGSEEPIYEKGDKLKKELGVTTLLVSHNMHVVMHYSDCILAINQHPLFFGETAGTSYSQLLNIMFGEDVSRIEEEVHRG